MSLRATPGQRALLSCLVFAGVGGAGAALAVRAPAYEATAQVVVTPLDGEEAPVGMPVFRDLGDPIRTIETAAALLRSRPAAQLTAQRLGGRWTADAVYEVVKVRPQGQTNLIEIVARTDEPESAAKVANGYTTAALDLRSKALAAASATALAAASQELASNPAGSAVADAAQTRYTDLQLLKTYGDPSAIEAQEAVPPTTPVGLPVPLMLGLAALAGLLSAAAVGVLLRDARSEAARHEDAQPQLAEPPRSEMVRHPQRTAVRTAVGVRAVAVDGDRD